MTELRRRMVEELRLRRDLFATTANSETIIRKKMVDRFKNGALSISPCWDGAEQMYLALCALNPSSALADLATERSFAPGFDGPRMGQRPFQPAAFLERLKRLPK